jgi:hypothetical protein
MLTRTISVLFFGLLFFFTALAGVIKEGSLAARSDGSTITIRWVSEDETSVEKFVIERKAGVNGAFMLLTELRPRGNNSAYQYIDDTAFRVLNENIYKYQIKVQFSNGSTAIYGPVTVVHSTSNVTKRTWGSIKAMFR